MGLFSIFSGSYKPKDFVGKTLDQIFKDMKLDKMDKSIKEHEEYAALSPEIKGAIDLLLDLKAGKSIIYEKCYKGQSVGVAAPAPRPHSITRPASITRPPVVRPASIRPPVVRPASIRPAAAAPAPAPAVKEKEEDDEDEGQSGGGRKRRKGKKGKKSRKGKKGKGKRKTVRR